MGRLAEQTNFLAALALALAIGLLIGVERGWSMRGEPAGSRVAGVRTFGLVGLVGGLAGVLLGTGAAAPALLLCLGAVMALLAGYWREMRLKETVSATSTLAGLVTLGLGLLAALGHGVAALASAAVVTLLLSSRARIHGWLRDLGEDDLQVTVRYAIISLAILPILPDARYGPFEAWNPRELWMVVVLVTGLSFAGYLANRRFGTTRGTLATAAIGGIYSSTAVSMALAQRLREPDASLPTISAGLALASAIMFVRVLALTTVLARAALPSLLLALAPATLAAVAVAWWLTRRAAAGGGGTQAIAPPGNPLNLLPALGFAALVALTALLTRWAEDRYGGAGAATLLLITGSFDVDAAVITLGGLPPGTIEPWLGGLLLAVPVMVNSLFKAGVVIVAGRGKGVRAASPLLGCAVLIGVACAIAAGLGR